MEQIINNLFLGSDNDHAYALSKGWPILVAAKAGPWGHQQELGYTSHGAPKDHTYYFVDHGNVRHLNLIDPDNPHLIGAEAINAGLEFIQKHIDNGPLLVHCNQGHSRGPSIVLMYLRTIGEMPNGYMQSQKKFKTIYPMYAPQQGIDQFTRFNWRRLLYEGQTTNVPDSSVSS